MALRKKSSLAKKRKLFCFIFPVWLGVTKKSKTSNSAQLRRRIPREPILKTRVSFEGSERDVGHCRSERVLILLHPIVPSVENLYLSGFVAFEVAHQGSFKPWLPTSMAQYALRNTSLTASAASRGAVPRNRCQEPAA